MPDLPAELARRLDEVFVDTGDRRWSRWMESGRCVRAIARSPFSSKVRQVITLGSPFAGNPRSTSVIVLRRRRLPLEQAPSNRLRLLAGEPLPGIPSTAIFSKTDGIVPWQIATQRPTEIAENIEVYASHIGLGISPAVLYATADRLANRDGQWRPFERQGWKRLVYGPAGLDDNESPSEPAPNKPAEAKHE
jgi:hypothetical protein